MSVSVVKKGELDGSSRGPPYVHGFPYISVVEAPPEILQGDRRFLLGDQKKAVFGDVNEEKKREKMDGVDDSCSSSTSSIGKNSDLSEGSLEEKSDDTEEVQSPLKPPSFHSIHPLEEALPIRRGISRFYNGRSKSFTTLREASSSSSIKELAKPENAYIRKRRNLLACALYLENNGNGKAKSSPFRYHGGGGISKKGANFSKTSLALATAMTCSSASSNDETILRSSPAISRLNPLFKGCQGNALPSSPYSVQRSLAWRSFSLADLQQCQHVSVSTGSKGAVNQLQMNQPS
ncbi:PREDICTED: uncharacterized protein LOC109150612 [Ipomoea nil]|uniref:uncharacterized protein LOC109150612 n=1 Tax=Ipomoea nil TaxID=35883 RepID=UPI000901CC05|nr:PREDICTED: uncharacterized protein LOC109150612 [Ipomoea nil]